MAKRLQVDEDVPKRMSVEDFRKMNETGKIPVTTSKVKRFSGSKVVFNIEPMGKPRMTQSDKWKKRDVTDRYWEFKDKLNTRANELGYVPGDKLSIRFYLQMPKRPKKHQQEGMPHQSKPDLDNLIKAFKDALLKDDSHVYEYGFMGKYWSNSPRIEVDVQ